jgi:hypothetical protein
MYPIIIHYLSLQVHGKVTPVLLSTIQTDLTQILFYTLVDQLGFKLQTQTYLFKSRSIYY